MKNPDGSCSICSTTTTKIYHCGSPCDKKQTFIRSEDLKSLEIPYGFIKSNPCTRCGGSGKEPKE